MLNGIAQKEDESESTASLATGRIQFHWKNKQGTQWERSKNVGRKCRSLWAYYFLAYPIRDPKPRIFFEGSFYFLPWFRHED